MAAVVAQAGCQVLGRSFGKESTTVGSGSSCGDSLECSFLGPSESLARLRGAGGVLCQKSRPVSTTSGSLFSIAPGSFLATMIPSRALMGRVTQSDTKVDLGKEKNEEEVEESSPSELLESINNVLADVVDGQKYLKETGRTKPRPMKRRSLVVCLAMGAIQPYLSDVEDRVVNLRRTASSSFAKTVCLASQLSVGASKAIESIAEECRKSHAERRPASEAETTIETLRRTTSTSLARVKSLVSQLSFGASRAVSYLTEELEKSDTDSHHLVPTPA